MTRAQDQGQGPGIRDKGPGPGTRDKDPGPRDKGPGPWQRGLVRPDGVGVACEPPVAHRPPASGTARLPRRDTRCLPQGHCVSAMARHCACTTRRIHNLPHGHFSYNLVSQFNTPGPGGSWWFLLRRFLYNRVLQRRLRWSHVDSSPPMARSTSKVSFPLKQHLYQEFTPSQTWTNDRGWEFLL